MPSWSTCRKLQHIRKILSWIWSQNRFIIVAVLVHPPIVPKKRRQFGFLTSEQRQAITCGIEVLADTPHRDFVNHDCLQDIRFFLVEWIPVFTKCSNIQTIYPCIWSTAVLKIPLIVCWYVHIERREESWINALCGSCNGEWDLVFKAILSQSVTFTF